MLSAVLGTSSSTGKVNYAANSLGFCRYLREKLRVTALSHSHGSCRENAALQGCLRPNRLLQIVSTEVLHTQSTANCNTTAPGIGCPCTAEESPPSGACSAGFICRKVSSAPQLHAQPSSNDTAKCWPCSFGQYCPAGSYLPDDPYSLPQAVEQYTCK